MKKRLMYFFIFSFFCSSLFSVEKRMTGEEIEALNQAFLVYCEDLEFNKDDFYNLEFIINEKNGLYYITISEHDVLGGIGNFVVNGETMKVVKKTYEE